MRKTTKVTAALFAVGLLSVFSPLQGEEEQEKRTEERASAAVTPTGQRDDGLRELDYRLQKRQWAEAYALASQLVEEWRGSRVDGIGPFLIRALLGLALAEAGLGREADALWHWQQTQNLGGVGDINLSVYGPPGALLAAHRLRWWDEPPRGMTVVTPEALGTAGTPPRKVSGSDLVLPGALATSEFLQWAWIQVVVDREGRVVEPVVLASPFPGVALAALETVRGWRFEPARRGGEPVAVYHEITLPPRGEVPLGNLLNERRLRKAHERLVAGDWQEALKMARASWNDTVGFDHPKSGQALALVAVAEAAMGEKEQAICRWRVAQYLSTDLYQADLSPFGPAGQMLEDHPWGPPLVRPERPKPYFGEETTPPRKISGASPVYTRRAKAAGVQGTALIEAVIEETGGVSRVTLLQNLPNGLDLAAMDAVCGWRFAPATSNGKPVRATYPLSVSFGLQ